MEEGEVTRPGISAKKQQALIESERPAVIPQHLDPLTGLPVEELRGGE